MSNFFYSRLGLTNIKNNKSIYIPYLIAGSFIVSLFYILLSISRMVSSAQNSFSGGENMAVLVYICTVICLVFSIIILFYINSFVMKRRKKEFGLYSILGMEKKHISIVLFFEVLFTTIICIVLGIGVGILLSQAMFLILLKLVRIQAVLTFTVPIDAVLITILVFSVFFAVVLIIDIIKIAKTKPIDLFKSTNTGEKEPRAKWVIALIGLLALGGGYFLSINVKNALEAIGVFLLAVLLVIIGTYCLFISGSIATLKLLKKKKSFYYKPNNFVSVSGMMYRMKQNAAGLASICILATAVLVTLSSTVCLFIGQEDLINQQFLREVELSSITRTDGNTDAFTKTTDKLSEKYNVTLSNKLVYTHSSFVAKKTNNGFAFPDGSETELFAVSVMPVKDFNMLSGTNYTLNDNEILLFDESSSFSGSIELLSKKYAIKGSIEEKDINKPNSALPIIAVVVKSYEQLVELNIGEKALPFTSYMFDIDGSKENIDAFFEGLRSDFHEADTNLATSQYIEYAKAEVYELYGTLLFIGAFFTMVFLLATILIIYYKQITEGFDDHDRFAIMQKVGMSKKEVRKTINNQVLMVFFLPLVMAVIHIAAAFPSLIKCLSVFNMNNTILFILCVAGTVLLFSIFYFIIYKLTARTYYKIVEQK